MRSRNPLSYYVKSEKRTAEQKAADAARFLEKSIDAGYPLGNLSAVAAVASSMFAEHAARLHQYHVQAIGVDYADLDDLIGQLEAPNGIPLRDDLRSELIG